MGQQYDEAVEALEDPERRKFFQDEMKREMQTRKNKQLEERMKELEKRACEDPETT